MSKTITVEIIGLGTDGATRKLKVNGEGELGVVVHEHPPIDEVLASIPFRQELTDDGTANGSSNMVINGLTTPTDFYIGSSTEFDIYIKYIDIELSDTGLTDWDKFGNLPALTNGIEILWKNNQTPDVIIDPAIKENKDFKRVATNLFDIIRISGSGADIIFPKIDFQILFGGRWGVRLRRGSTDRLIFRVTDNLIGLDTFSANGYGREV